MSVMFYFANDTHYSSHSISFRENCFETNSSSNHAFHMGKDVDLLEVIPRDVLRSGVWKITLEPKDYNKIDSQTRVYRYRTAESKLQFILEDIAYTYLETALRRVQKRDQEITHYVKKSLSVTKILSAIKDLTGLDVEIYAAKRYSPRLRNDVLTDHVQYFTLNDQRIEIPDLARFIFNPASWVERKNFETMSADTDIDNMFYYDNRVNRTHVEDNSIIHCTMRLTHSANSSSLVIDTGTQHASFEAQKFTAYGDLPLVLAQIAKHGGCELNSIELNVPVLTFNSSNNCGDTVLSEILSNVVECAKQFENSGETSHIDGWKNDLTFSKNFTAKYNVFETANIGSSLNDNVECIMNLRMRHESFDLVQQNAADRRNRNEYGLK